MQAQLLNQFSFVVRFQQQSSVFLLAKQEHHTCFGDVLIVGNDKFSHIGYKDNANRGRMK